LTYDRQAIIDDYKRGLSLSKVGKKYGISVSYVAYILAKAGVSTRSRFGATTVEWHKLPRVEKTRTRIISIPSTILEQMGIDSSKDLLGKWLIDNSGLRLLVKEV